MDYDLIQSLPLFLQQSLPFELTHCSGMDHGLAYLHDYCYVKGMSPEPLERMLEVYASTQYDRKRCLWCSTLKWHHSVLLEETLGPKGWSQAKETDFLDCDHEKAILPRLPSATYINALWRICSKHHEGDLVQQMSLLPLTIAKNDMSFKAVKRQVRINGESMFTAVSCTMNENGHVRGLHVMLTKSQDHLHDFVCEVQESLQINNHSPISLLYLNDVEHNGPFWAQHFPSLHQNVARITTKNPAGLLYAELKPGVKIIYLNTDDDNELSKTCQIIEAIKMEQGNCVLGFGTQHHYHLRVNI